MRHMRQLRIKCIKGPVEEQTINCNTFGKHCSYKEYLHIIRSLNVSSPNGPLFQPLSSQFSSMLLDLDNKKTGLYMYIANPCFFLLLHFHSFIRFNDFIYTHHRFNLWNVTEFLFFIFCWVLLLFSPFYFQKSVGWAEFLLLKVSHVSPRQPSLLYYYYTIFDFSLCVFKVCVLSQHSERFFQKAGHYIEDETKRKEVSDSLYILYKRKEKKSSGWRCLV